MTSRTNWPRRRTSDDNDAYVNDSHVNTETRSQSGVRAMTYRILHIDDDADIREIVQFSLALDPGLAPMSCASGRDALAIAAEWAPDLILCDVMMPGMDGPTTLARLRENPKTSKIPVVFMTARAGSNELEHLM